MKRQWTRGEKLLWATPLVFVIGAGVAAWGPQVMRTVTGLPRILPVSSGVFVQSLALSREGRVLATANGDSNSPKSLGGEIRFWNAQALQSLPNAGTAINRGLKRGSAVVAFDLAPDGKSLVYARSDYNVSLGAKGRETPLQLYDLASGRTLWRLAPNFYTSAVRFSPDGQTLGAMRWHMGKTQYEFYALRSRDGAILDHWPIEDADYLWGEFRWMPDGKTVIMMRQQKIKKSAKTLRPRYRLEVRRAQDGRVLYSWPTSSLLDAVPSPDGASLICFANAKENPEIAVTLINAKTGQQQWRYEADGNCRGAVSPDGKTLAVFVAGQSPRVELLDFGTGISTRTLRVKARQVNGDVLHVILWAPDGERLYARGKNAVLVWDLN